MIRYVFRPKRRKKGRSISRENYRGRYRLPGQTKIHDVPLHTTDKRVAEQRLDAIVREAQQEAAGIIPPRAMRESAERPVADHVGEFAEDLTARGRANAYVAHVEHRLQRLARGCGWEFPRDVTAESFLAWRVTADKSAKTLNEYLAAAKQLLSWMRRQGRVAANPLEVVGKVETNGREERKRRALTDDEVTRLLSVAGDRRVAYLAALLTGLRRGELDALKWGDVHLESPQPFLDVRASTTKNKQRAVIFLRDDLAAELATVRPADASDGDRVFPRRVPKIR